MTDKSPHGPLISLWLPLAVIRKSGTVRGITRLQKLVFLASIEGKIGDYLGFTEYKYGPWSQVLQNMTHNLTEWGHLDCEEEEMPAPYSPRQNYRITEQGLTFLEKIERGFDFICDLNEKLDVLDKYQTMETRDIRDYVYRTYLPHKLFGDATYEERLRFLQSEAGSYTEVWMNFQEEHYPTSFFILAVLEHTSKVLRTLDEKKPSLESNIVLTACAFLLQAIWRLLDILETTATASPEICQIAQMMRGEVEEVLIFMDSEMAKVLELIPFHRLNISNLTELPEG